MAGGPLGGRYGVANGITALRNWTINDNGTLAAYVNSATAIGQGSQPGVSSWTGGYSNHGHTPPVLPGELFTFEGYTAPDDGIFGNVGYKYAGNAIVDSVAINWDWTSGTVIENQTSFLGVENITPSPGGYPWTDPGSDDPPPVCGTKIEYSVDGSTWTELDHIMQASLQITNNVQSYVNSTTNCGTGRRAGTVNFNCSIVLQDTYFGGGLTKFGIYQFRMYVNDTEFWLLKWARVQEFTGLQVSPETGAIIQHSVSLGMSARKSGVLGSIKAPGASSSYWGA